jgi:hypothetical protein
MPITKQEGSVVESAQVGLANIEFASKRKSWWPPHDNEEDLLNEYTTPLYVEDKSKW